MPTTTTATTSTTAGASAVLSARGVTRRFRMGETTLHVLTGIDLDVAEGRWLAVLGRSGSGKSTLLHLLGGLDRPNEGQVVFRGRGVFGSGGVDRFRNRDVGFVFQFYHLLPELNVLENTLMPAMIRAGPLRWWRARRAARDRARELLGRFGLGQRLRHRPAKLSGGERQRVAIARALINEPAVLLADEPTGNLDADTGAQIMDVFDELHARGQTIVMVTHDARVAARADDRLTLDHGHLIPNEPGNGA